MKGLIVQCPHCLHLVSLNTGTLKNHTICWDCEACKKSIALPFVAGDSVERPERREKPAPALLESEIEPLHIPASNIEALPLSPQEAHAPPHQPIPDGVAKKIESLQSDRPGALGIKNAFCRLWEHQWDAPEAHERFVQKANQQNALPIAGQLYGAILQKFPDEKIAANGREKILNLGLLQLGHLRTNVPTSNRKITPKKLFWGIGVGIGIILVAFIFSTLNNVIHSTTSLAK